MKESALFGFIFGACLFIAGVNDLTAWQTWFLIVAGAAQFTAGRIIGD